MVNCFFQDHASFLRHDQRNAHADGNALAERAADFHRPAQGAGPFHHAAKAVRCGLHDCAFRNADAVIENFQRDLIMLAPHVDQHLAGLGIARHIGKRLLENAEQGDANFLRQRDFLAMHRHLALDVVTLGKFGRLPLHRCQQAEVIQQVGRSSVTMRRMAWTDASTRSDMDATFSLHAFQFWRQLARQPVNIHFQCGEITAQFVVNFPRNGRFFFLPRGLEVVGQLAQLFARFANFLLGLLALGNVLHRAEQRSPRRRH